MKYSKQRELILKTVRENRVHPTADYVYHFLKKDHPNLSLGTVYRNLNLLSENGDIRKICIPNARDRFDGRMDRHYHMVCQECAEVFDIELNCLSKLEEEISSRTDFIVHGYDVIITGVCYTCQHKLNESKKEVS